MNYGLGIIKQSRIMKLMNVKKIISTHYRRREGSIAIIVNAGLSCLVYVFCMTSSGVFADVNTDSVIETDIDNSDSYSGDDSIDSRIFHLEQIVYGKTNVNNRYARKLNVGGYVLAEHILSKSEKLDDENHSNIDSGNRIRNDLIFNGEVTSQLNFSINTLMLVDTAPQFFDRHSAVRSSENQRRDVSFFYRAYGEYLFPNMLHFKFGRMISPTSYLYESYSEMTQTIYPFPQMYGQVVSLTIYNTIFDGVQLFGPLANSKNLFFHLYAGTNSPSQGDFYQDSVAVRLARQSPNKIFVGSRLKSHLLDQKLSLGITMQVGRNDCDYYKYGFDFRLAYNRIHVLGEFSNSYEKEVKDVGEFESIRDAVLAAYVSNDQNNYKLSLDRLDRHLESRLDSNKHAYYFEPTYYLSDRYLLAVRYDYINYNIPFVNNGDEKKIYTVALNYNPIPMLKFRAALAMHDFKSKNGKDLLDPFDDEKTRMANNKNPDYYTLGVSSVLSF